MPLPDHAFTIKGGCNCRAIRYKCEVPELSARSPSYYHSHPSPDSAEDYEGNDCRFPCVVVCHCNNCRMAVGSVLMFAICCPDDYVSLSCEKRDTSTAVAIGGITKKEKNEEEAAEDWVPAKPMFELTPEAAEARSSTYLTAYNSSQGKYRVFCSRCGTSLAYFINPVPKMLEGKPQMLDLTLATLDREDLEKEWMVPERHLWMDYGVDWIAKFALNGLDVPRHGIWQVDKEWKGHK